MKKRRSLIIIGFIVMLATVFASVIEAYAQDTSPVAERPQYIAGEKWIFDRNGKKWETSFVRYEDNGSFVRLVTIESADSSQFWHFSADLNPFKVTDMKGRTIWKHGGEYTMYRFPLKVGKRWDEIYHSQGFVARRMQAEVTSYEKVTVPAGAFWAFKIEATNHRLDRLRPAYETYWFAPVVKNIVRYSSNEFEVEMKLVQYISAPTAAKRDN